MRDIVVSEELLTSETFILSTPSILYTTLPTHVAILCCPITFFNTIQTMYQTLHNSSHAQPTHRSRRHPARQTMPPKLPSSPTHTLNVWRHARAPHQRLGKKSSPKMHLHMYCGMPLFSKTAQQITCIHWPTRRVINKAERIPPSIASHPPANSARASDPVTSKTTPSRREGPAFLKSHLRRTCLPAHRLVGLDWTD